MELEIISANYWENWKYAKELDQSLGSDHPKSIKQREQTNLIFEEWTALKKQQ